MFYFATLWLMLMILPGPDTLIGGAAGVPQRGPEVTGGPFRGIVPDPGPSYRGGRTLSNPLPLCASTSHQHYFSLYVGTLPACDL